MYRFQKPVRWMLSCIMCIIFLFVSCKTFDTRILSNLAHSALDGDEASMVELALFLIDKIELFEVREAKSNANQKEVSDEELRQGKSIPQIPEVRIIQANMDRTTPKVYLGESIHFYLRYRVVGVENKLINLNILRTDELHYRYDADTAFIPIDKLNQRTPLPSIGDQTSPLVMKFSDRDAEGYYRIITKIEVTNGTVVGTIPVTYDFVLGDKPIPTTSYSPTVSSPSSLNPTIPSSQDEYNVYYVKKGDTIGKIAVKHDVSVDAILNANKNISNPNQIQIGDRIRIPK